ncbi:hypothetical protein FHP25_08805 [Vineibacter terrae]|uniref:Protein kinase domain-containing protein n=1 Tax=Vineibacter terrae TaxID=2586908 RepID=A0A5C8PQQ9_9HYPH|nr:protein kinase [Vineibacter terrae]TXL77523.1 hypothetical protein FHP25_08805 [Vineibacter terrae]
MADNLSSRPAGSPPFGALPAGYVLGQYQLQGVLGVGGFGITYRAADNRLRRPVAIKEYLPSDFAARAGDASVRPRAPTDQEMFRWGLTRFLDEARTLAALNDAPNIVHVYDFLEANGTGYMVMELVEGEPLDKIVARLGKLTAPSVLPMTQALLRGLEAVHRAGYLHRDIKPANVLLRPNGEPVLVDFGAARMSMGKRTQVMTSIYSPGYAPPEQYAQGAEARKQGPWSDLYALAATLYHVITGSAPADAIRRLAKDNYVPLTQSAAGQFPPGFLSAVDAALALPVERRPQSVIAWNQMLFGDAYGAGPLSRGGPPGLFAPPPMSMQGTPPGASMRGGPMPGAPMQGPPMQGPPMHGAPMQGPPMHGASMQGGYPQAGAAWPGAPYGSAPPASHGFDPAAASRGGMPPPGAPPQSFAPPPPSPFPGHSRPPGAPPARRGGTGIWIAIGTLAVLLLAVGAGAYYYLCGLTTSCSSSGGDTTACYEEVARVRVEIQRVVATLPGQTAAAPAPGLTCSQELTRAKAELARLQELARSQSKTPPVVVPSRPEPIPLPPPPVDVKPPVVEPPPPPVEPKPPVVEPRPPAPPVDTAPVPAPPVPTPPPTPPVVEPKPPTPTPAPPPPTPPVATPKPPPQPAPPPPVEPPSPYAVHEGRWFGSANLLRESGQGRCAPVFTLTGMVRDNIFNGTSSLGGSAAIRIRSRTKRVTDIALPGVAVRSTNGTFDNFNFETATGCVYAVRMFRQ